MTTDATTTDATNSTHIDCDSCQVRGAACGDCVVTVLLGAAPDGVRLDTDARVAIAVLADSGLVPPLRLVPPVGPAQGVPHRDGSGRSGQEGHAGRALSAG